MSEFMIAYHGGNPPKTKEEGMAHMEKWKKWVEGLGDQVLNPGTPLPKSKLVTAEGVEEDQRPDAMMGFAVIKAENMEAAIAIAKTDPFLETGGQIRLSEMMKMPG